MVAVEIFLSAKSSSRLPFCFRTFRMISPISLIPIPFILLHTPFPLLVLLSVYPLLYDFEIQNYCLQSKGPIEFFDSNLKKTSHQGEVRVKASLY